MRKIYLIFISFIIELMNQIEIIPVNNLKINL
jgi:hypothetical protein